MIETGATQHDFVPVACCDQGVPKIVRHAPIQVQVAGPDVRKVHSGRGSRTNSVRKIRPAILEQWHNAVGNRNFNGFAHTCSRMPAADTLNCEAAHFQESEKSTNQQEMYRRPQFLEGREPHCGTGGRSQRHEHRTTQSYDQTA
jgi:hypothetical protein